MRTLDRYLLREVAETWLAVTGVLLVILLSNQLARVLSQAAANDFPRDVVFALLGLTSAGYLTVIAPIGFFLAIMLGLGRMYHESEMAAIQSCGVGPSGLYRPISYLGVVIAALLFWLSFWAIPLARVRPRQGRFGRIGIAILFYFVYSLLLDGARTWVEGGAVPAWLGPWWVHAIAVALGLWLLSREAPFGKKARPVTVPA